MSLVSSLVLLVVLGTSNATFQLIGQALSNINNIVGGWLHGPGFGSVPGIRCGPCPDETALDCRLVPAIVLGYCCGCALPIDHVPMKCAPNLICPPNMDKLCADYNYLMDCCCPGVYLTPPLYR